nr:TonB-dependent receptor [Flagellatimonas centrodinii]
MAQRVFFTLRLPSVSARNRVLPRWLLLVLALAFTPLVAHAQTTDEAARYYDIPAQSLAAALNQFSVETDRQLVFAPELVEDKTAAAVQGDYTPEAVIRMLLADTGLTYVPTQNGVYAVVRIGEEDSVPFALAANGDAAPTPAPITNVSDARRAGVEEIIVTGQKKAERLQDVPIAISAFSMETLDAQKIEGGFDLLKAVPNVTFSKTNFSGYNFQIRGIGTQAVSATTDPGVAVSFNNTTLIVNRLFEQEYLDIERVEVLRGPQGTLYGRNATAGVINVITAKPVLGDAFGEIKLESGNFNARRLRGHYNIPLGDTFALRAAYASTVRDGYGINEAADDLSIPAADRPSRDIDNRDLWSGRLTLGWEPSDRVRFNLLYERFEEDDQRVRSVKQLCHRDDGPTSIGDLDFSTLTNTLTGGNGEQAGVILQDALSQGCLPGSLYAQGAFDAPNGYAIPFVAATRTPGQSGGLGDNPYFGSINLQAECDLAEVAQYLSLINPCVGDPFANATQSRNLRQIYSTIEPRYEAESDIFELSVDIDIADGLVFSSQTVYVKDSVLSTQDFNRYETARNFFSDSSNACPTSLSGSGPFGLCNNPAFIDLLGTSFFADVTPDGIFCDPQLGCSDRFQFMDLSRASGSQFNQEVRLVSAFSSDVNFSIGANYTRFQTTNDYFVMSNALSILARTPPFTGDGRLPGGRLCNTGGLGPSDYASCVYTDPQSLDELINDDSPEGHNYFLSRNPYELNSAAAFGELYWQATDMFKVTAGLRVTWDRKSFTPVPSQTLLMGYKQSLGGVPYEDPSQCTDSFVIAFCPIFGSTPDGRGFVAEPDIIQSWLEPTGRLGFDWKVDTGFTDETMLYGFLTRGYKAGGANPPGIAPPQGAFIAAAQGAVSPKVFKAEYVNAIELGAKNTLLDGALTLNMSAFYYDYQDYQISKIVDRSAANENVDATVWGLELEAMFALTQDTLLNAAVGFLRTRIADGEQSIDLIDRTQGGTYFQITTIENPNFDPSATPRDRANYVAGLDAPSDQQFLAFDEWLVVKPSVTQASNCVAPAELAAVAAANVPGSPADAVAAFCPGGPLLGSNYTNTIVWGTPAIFPDAGGIFYNPILDAPNGSAGMFADLSGNELPNAPRFTVALGAQHTFYLPGNWDLTGRVDWYWQDESFHRIYNTEYDRLKDWQNTNLSVWVNQEQWGLKIEAYVKNVFDETPITGAFLNSDDTALTTNIFTLDPRLIGVSITKRF